MMRIMAIDPGSAESAFILVNPDCSFSSEDAFKAPNALALKSVKEIGAVYGGEMTVVIEMVASYGMAVGKEVFETCVWIGRFTQAAADAGCQVEYVYRMEEKLALCHSSKARDSNIRQALIDRFARFDKKNGKGTKAHPDTFYGFRADMWSAFAVACVFLDKRAGNAEK